MIKVILVDDHALYRNGISTALSKLCDDIQIVGEADSGEALFKLLNTTSADIILLDIMLPDMNGIEIARRLHADYPLIKILVLSAENTAEMVSAMLDVGIDGFISKGATKDSDIREAIRSVMNGSEYFGKDISAIIYKVYVARNSSLKTSKPEFTKRELEIINLCREGLLCKEIAERLNISPRTVENHKNNIFDRLGLHSTSEVIQYALKYKIISL